MKRNVVMILIGVLLTVGLLFLFKAEPDVIIREIVTVDTVVVRDTITIKEFIRTTDIVVDTVYVNNVDTITVYRASFGLQYGTVNVFTHSTGKIFDQYITTALNIPTETKYITINRDITRTIREKPLYLGVGFKTGISDNPNVAVGLSLNTHNHYFAYHLDLDRTHWLTYHKNFQIILPRWIKQ